MIDYRNVYIKEQTSYKGKGRRIKIGIAKDMAKRQYQVNNGLPGTWGEVMHKRMFFARSTELDLHRRLDAYRTPLENLKPGAGGSEIFTISTHKLAILRLTLGALSAADVFISFTLMAISCKAILLIWYFLF